MRRNILSASLTYREMGRTWNPTSKAAACHSSARYYSICTCLCVRMNAVKQDRLAAVADYRTAGSTAFRSRMLQTRVCSAEGTRTHVQVQCLQRYWSGLCTANSFYLPRCDRWIQEWPVVHCSRLPVSDPLRNTMYIR